jgi:TusA-related sulfurtransferase
MRIDLRGTPCPLNWVKTKLRLEQMAPGAVLEVWVDDGAPAQNVPRSAVAEGHEVVETGPVEDGVRLVIKKAAL